MESIKCHVREGLSDDDAALIEIDENLIRADLTPDEKREHLRQRKELWEKRQAQQVMAHHAPKPRSGPKGGRPKGFAADTAEKTGMSKSQVNRLLAEPKSAPKLPKITVTMPTGIKAAREHYALEFAELGSLPAQDAEMKLLGAAIDKALEAVSDD